MEQIPEQVWMLWNREDGGFVLALDESGNDGDYLCYLSKDDAEAGARHHMDIYDIDCEPVRVK